jgi:ligand-binding sensor domain-containing protein
VAVVAQGVDHGLWVGTDGGLVRLRKRRFTVCTQRDGLGNDFIGSIFQDVEGSVWAETRARHGI